MQEWIVAKRLNDENAVCTIENSASIENKCLDLNKCVIYRVHSILNIASNCCTPAYRYILVLLYGPEGEFVWCAQSAQLMHRRRRSNQLIRYICTNKTYTGIVSFLIALIFIVIPIVSNIGLLIAWCIHLFQLRIDYSSIRLNAFACTASNDDDDGRTLISIECHQLLVYAE